ncbi:MAG: T9SS type A sorting domain-containing protein [Flavobacterium sp.]
MPINLSGLPQGVYLIEVETDVSSDSVKVIKK